MEEKTIVITEKAENAILGQESVFGWQMKEKKPAGKFMIFKYNQYTLTRNRNPEDVTQAHIDVESRWNSEFQVWNKFILNGIKKYIIMEIVAWLFILVGFILMIAGMSSMDVYSDSLPGTYIAGLIILLLSLAISIPVLVIFLKNGSSKIKKMDAISRDMRQVNAIRSNNSNN